MEGVFLIPFGLFPSSSAKGKFVRTLTHFSDKTPLMNDDKKEQKKLLSDGQFIPALASSTNFSIYPMYTYISFYIKSCLCCLFLLYVIRNFRHTHHVFYRGNFFFLLSVFSTYFLLEIPKTCLKRTKYRGHAILNYI